MRDPLSKKITGIAPSGIRKFFDIVSEMPDAISLGVGEPDFDTPWRVREEGIYTLEKGRTFYTSNAGLKELRQEISNYCLLYTSRAAATFGFPEFIAEADVNVTLEPQERNENQQFGYWCRQVRRPPR